MENERIYSQEKIKNEYRVNYQSVASKDHPERNEDKIYINQDKNIFALFDGVGGIKNGEIASLTCSEILSQASERLTVNSSEDNLEFFLKKVIDSSNKKNFDNKVCSTAIIGALYGNDKNRKMMLVNVGDSRCYLLRNKELNQITIDDNEISRSYGYGERCRELQKKLNNCTDPQRDLKSDEQVYFNYRNVVTSVTGKKENIEGKFYNFNVKNGDKVLFCSDGISDNLTDTEIKNILMNTNMESEFLIQKANEVSKSNSARSKVDDMSAIVVNF